MTKITKIIIKFWYLLPLLLALLMLSLVYLFTTSPSVLEDIIGVLLLLTLIALPISWIVLLNNKKKWSCVASIISSVVIFVVLEFPLMMLASSSPDGFGKEHSIPVGLAYNLPLPCVYDSCSIASVDTLVTVDSLVTDTYLNIWNSFQGGIYTYDFYYGPLPTGEIYLRCFEVTETIPLSEDRLTESSRVKIKQTTSFSKKVDHQEFTIYEGDWGDYYAARIEVWFKNATTKEEKKLLEKIYRVEGWMR